MVSLATPGVRAWAVWCQGLMTLSGVSKLSGPQVRGAHGLGGTRGCPQKVPVVKPRGKASLSGLQLEPLCTLTGP